VRISGSAPSYDNNEAAAKRAEAEAIYAKLHAPAEPAQPQPEQKPAKEVPTYAEWFNNRFWNEWVIGERNKPSERRSKEIIFRVHLNLVIGHLRLDEINAEVVQQLRAKLVKEKGLGDKRINNIMVVLSRSLRYAMDCELIDQVPKCRVRKIERGEMEAWSFDEYPRILAAARLQGPFWYAPHLSQGRLARARMARDAPQRYSLRSLRGEPMAAHGVDGPQAHRRDHGLRAPRGAEAAPDPNRDC